MEKRIAPLTLLLLLILGSPLLLLGKIPENLLIPSPWKRSLPLYPGIQHLRWLFPQPRRMMVNAVLIDLNRPGLQFVATQADPKAGQPMPDCDRFTIRTKRTTTGDFLMQCRKGELSQGFPLPVVLAVNAAPWVPWETPYTHTYADGMGLLVSQGKLVCPAKGSPGLVVTKNKKLEFRDFPKDTPPPEDVWIALCGFGMVLKNNTILQGDNPKDLHPRMVWGLTEDHTKLILMAVDGRQEGYSMGANLHECAQLMQWLGATEALNMDGGGSTTMVFWDPVMNAARLLNRPTSDGKYQRPVACSLGIYYTP
ncbi:MAG: phosphodiester glycosidase family protein [Oligosphaeraceae bacterium]